jgi:hypothetical protein
MIWFLGEQRALHVERERRAIAELAESVPWLRIVGWRLDRVGVQLCVDADIVRSEAVSFPVTLRYPDLFPHTPPSVLPRGDVKERWSEHQYLVGDRPDELCLEYGPDNWTSDLSGADLLRSAHRLLVGQGGEGGGPAPPVPSRHGTTLGQELRSAWLRFVATPAFAAFARGLPSAALVPATLRSVWQEPSFVAMVGTARPAESPAWTDSTVPNDLGAGREGVIVRLQDEEGGIIKATSFAELCGLLLGAGIDLGAWVGAQETVPEFIVLAAADRVAVRWRPDTSKDELLRFETIMAPDDGGARVSPACRDLASKKVAVVGCGSAGSKIGVSLARSGVGHFVLVDDDVLLPGNLVRNELDWRDVGGHKAEGLWNRIKLVNPAATASVRKRRLSAQEASASAAVVLSAVAGCDVIVDATADPTVFNLLSSVVVQEGKALVWLEIFGGGYGGLVARHRPGIDADPQSMRAGVRGWCARQGESWPAGARDYEADGGYGAPLVAEDADVAVIAAHAARMALDQLWGGQSRFPHSIYLVGLSEGWVFKEPFETRPIDVDMAEKPVDRAADPAEVLAGLEFVERLVRRLLDETAGSR